MISLSALTVLVWLALGITVLAPILLIGLLIRDNKRGDLW
tara:strand:+ start:449 stop:568 length:120 start_codon:yes stop_codon:yes gene_type:complete